jgi:Peptidase M66
MKRTPHTAHRTPHTALLILLLLCLFQRTLVAQGLEDTIPIIDCATSSGSSSNKEELLITPCIDINDILSSNKLIYVRVNFHFFVNNNCSGNFDVNHTGASNNGWPQTQAFYDCTQANCVGLTERWINKMNAALANNTAQKLSGGLYAPTIPNVPIRFVIGDVKIHCRQDFKQYKPFNVRYNTFGQYAQPGLNIYFSQSAWGSATGEANGVGGQGASISVVGMKNLLHEIGHNLGLGHTFEPFQDECDDTPYEGVNWNKNCNSNSNEWSYSE